MGDITKLLEVIRKGIADENDSISQYLKNAEELEREFPEVSAVIRDIADEELAHVGELQEVLNQYVAGATDKIQGGQEEAEKFFGSKEQPSEEPIDVPQAEPEVNPAEVPTEETENQIGESAEVTEDSGAIGSLGAAPVVAAGVLMPQEGGTVKSKGCKEVRKLKRLLGRK